MWGLRGRPVHMRPLRGIVVPGPNVCVPWRMYAGTPCATDCGAPRKPEHGLSHCLSLVPLIPCQQFVCEICVKRVSDVYVSIGLTEHTDRGAPVSGSQIRSGQSRRTKAGKQEGRQGQIGQNWCVCVCVCVRAKRIMSLVSVYVRCSVSDTGLCDEPRRQTKAPSSVCGYVCVCATAAGLCRDPCTSMCRSVCHPEAPGFTGSHWALCWAAWSSTHIVFVRPHSVCLCVSGPLTDPRNHHSHSSQAQCSSDAHVSWSVSLGYL